MAAFTFYFGLHSPFSMSYFSSSSLGGGDHDNPYVLGGGGGGGKFVSSLLFTAVLALSLLSLLFVIISFFLLKKKRLHEAQTFDVTRQDPPQVVHESDESRRDDPTQLSHSLLLDLLPPDSEPGPGTTQKKKKKRARKKNKKSDDARRAEEEREDEVEGERSDSGRPSSDSDSRAKPELICLYPFTSSSSATQRRIKQHYDELVKCHESKGLTLAQVSQFVNCLVEARSELQHKSEVIQRRFTITKALLFKADRSSFDRLRQQIYKLELEQKRLEEDAFVYNWLQQQLKLSPAYKKMLELSTSMESKAKSGELVEAEDSDVPEISFEELLAQEKKDSFWQKTRKSRCCSN